MEFRTDFAALESGREVLLACQVGSNEVLVLARLHWFGEGEVKTQGWQSTFTGERLPDLWKPYAYWPAKAPDPALLEDDADGY